MTTDSAARELARTSASCFLLVTPSSRVCLVATAFQRVCGVALCDDWHQMVQEMKCGIKLREMEGYNDCRKWRCLVMAKSGGVL